MKNWKKIFKYLYVIPTAFFLVTIFGMAVKNYPYIKELVGNTLPIQTENLTNEFETDIRDNLAEKNELIDLNGKMAKVLGMNLLNERQRLENGYLSILGGYIPTDDLTGMVTEIASFFNENEINYLYVHAPSKPYFYGAPFAAGYENTGHEAWETFMNSITSAGVRYIDMDAWFEENQWGMEDVYFKTDHHWKPEAAYAAVQQVMKRLSEEDAAVYEEATLDLENWNVEVYENYWMGSDGQRTGISYAGTDDLSFIYPKFETDVSLSYLTYEGEMKQQNSVYFPELVAQPDYETGDSYYVYMGENHPYAYITNSTAVNDQRIIVVGDSFRIPFETFLATQFTEIYHIDLRYYNSGTFAEFVKEIEPDYVLMVYCGPTYAGGSGQYNFGVAEWKEAFSDTKPSQVLFSVEEVSIAERANANHYELIVGNLEAGAYEMNFDTVTISRNPEISEKEPGAYVQASLIDLKTGEIIKSRYLHTDYEETQKWLFTVPQTDNANYAVILYAGMAHDTEGITASLSGVTLTKYESTEK